MGTISQFIQRASAIISQIVFRNTSFETVLSYDRKDGKRVEFVLVHLPNISGEGPQEPFLALSSRSIRRNPNCVPNSLLNLSMEEARLLRDYLNRPETTLWLEEEA